jgi:hypothetical protein
MDRQPDEQMDRYITESCTDRQISKLTDKFGQRLKKRWMVRQVDRLTDGMHKDR